jgi:hypothetical protein
MSAARSAAIVVIACAATAALAACQPHTPVAAQSSSALKTAPTAPAAASPATAPSTPAPATSPTTAPSTTAPVTASASAPAVSPSAQAATSSAPAPAPSCASAPGGADIPHSSITVCPDAGPIGSVVHVTISHCAPTVNGQPDLPADGLFFLGPKSWLGTNGGGGAYVQYSPQTGHQATATFTIPATYIGGNQHGPYPTLRVTPGTGYTFTTDPAGECNIAFTVTAP